MKTLALVIALAACTGANAESIPGVRPSEPKPVMLVPPALVTAAVPSVRIAPEGKTAAESAAPEAGLQGGNAVDTAVAKAQTAPEAIAMAESAAPEAQLPSGGSVNEAVAQAQTFPESSAAQSAEPGECRIGSASQVEDAGLEAAKVAASAVDSTTDSAADAPIFDEVALGKTDGMSPSVALEDAKPIGEATPRKTNAMPEPKSDADCSLIGIYAKKRMLSGPWSASRRLEAARIRGDEEEAKRMEVMLDDFVGKAIFEEPD